MPLPTVTTLMHGNRVSDYAWDIMKNAIVTSEFSSGAQRLISLKDWLSFTETLDFKSDLVLDAWISQLNRAAGDAGYANTLQDCLSKAMSQEMK